jgi:hypothetical protein
MMEGQARWSGLVMGFDNHMIAGNRACPTFSPADSPDHHQPVKPALCRGPGIVLNAPTMAKAILPGHFLRPGGGAGSMTNRRSLATPEHTRANW